MNHITACVRVDYIISALDRDPNLIVHNKEMWCQWLLQISLELALFGTYAHYELHRAIASVPRYCQAKCTNINDK